jgi:uncharacterized protein (DUF39 family)
MAYFTGIGNKDIKYQVIDYGIDYPNNINRSLGEVSYEELQSGQIQIQGKSVPSTPLSSYFMAAQIADVLKNWILKSGFTLGEPQLFLPTVPFDTQKYPQLNPL